MICLDTNAVIGLLELVASSIHDRFKAAISGGETIVVPTVVLFELVYGAAKSERRASNFRRIADFRAGPVSFLAFDAEDAEVAGSIRADLDRKGLPISPYDVLIAAQARRRDALLVTANEREFRRVPGLRVENWAT
jgi:tRNA(fMet)-specific endonuclease VapC